MENSRKVLETKLNILLNNLDDCNIYVHHIWGMEDNPISIKNWIMGSGLNVRYNRGMFSTVMPMENPNASDIIEYYFANKHSSRINVVMAIPKNITINHQVIPFSENIESYNPKDVARMNEAYINLFDLCRGVNGSSITNQFVLGAVTIDEDNCSFELNSTFEPEKGVEIYADKIKSYIDIVESDGREEIIEKISTKMEMRNADIGMRDTFDDFDID